MEKALVAFFFLSITKELLLFHISVTQGLWRERKNICEKLLPVFSSYNHVLWGKANLCSTEILLFVKLVYISNLKKISILKDWEKKLLRFNSILDSYAAALHQPCFQSYKYIIPKLQIPSCKLFICTYCTIFCYR